MGGDRTRNGLSVRELPRVSGERSRSLGWLTPVLVVTDTVCINLAFYLAYWLRYQVEWPTPVEDVFYAPYRVYFPVGLLLATLLLVVFRLEGVYADNRGETWLDEMYRLVNGTTTGIVVAVVFYFFYRPAVYSRLVFFYAAILIVLLLAIVRAIKHMGLDYLRRRGIGVVRVLIVGAGEVGRAVIRSIVAHPELGYQIVGFVDDDPEDGSHDLGRIRSLGPTSRVNSLVRDGSVDQVIVTLPWVHHRQILAIMSDCQELGVGARVVPDIFQLSLNRVDVQQLDGIPLLGLREPRISGLNRLFKRTVDVVAGLVGVIGLAVVYVPVAIAIKLDSPGPVIYSQERVGRHGKRFMIHKFRSMSLDADDQMRDLLDQNEADGPLFKMRDDPRRTRVGKVLRRLSLDEWPQFINVLLGDMSLIGPRPNRPHEVAEYKTWHRRRLDVKPGMTGLWQVSGRSDVPFDEMVLLDIYYIDNWSLFMDLQIALRTLLLPLTGRGAY